MSDLPPPAPTARVLFPPPLPRAALTRGAGCMLTSFGIAELRALLAERDRLAARLQELDLESERLARAVQRVGGISEAPRPFTGDHPRIVASSSEIDSEIRRLSERMKELTAVISEHELAVHDLERPRERRLASIVGALIVIAGIVTAVLIATGSL